MQGKGIWNLPGFGGTVAFGFGAAIAVASMILLALKVNEPEKKSKNFHREHR